MGLSICADDEDLAIEQLPAPGRANDPDLAGAQALAASGSNFAPAPLI
jgi:hypothetical protein